MTERLPSPSRNGRSLRLTVDLGLRKILPIVFRPFIRPSLDVLSRSAELQSTNALEVISRLLECTEESLARFSKEYTSLDCHVSSRTVGGSPFPASHDLDLVHALSTYWVVRTLRPARVVESGVANGVSSRAILLALQHNGWGELHSFDLTESVGSLVDQAVRARWKLHVAPVGGRARSFRKELSEIGPIDLFLHDSEHTYRWQMMEFKAAWRALRPLGVLASDDIDSSFAFQDFSRQVGVKGYHVVSGRKVFGCIRKTDLRSGEDASATTKDA
jgi:methyltransferase family protein